MSLNSHLRSYETFEAYKSAMISQNATETLVQIEIVEAYKERVPEYVEAIRETSNGISIENPNVQLVFSTVHKSKGLEFPRVIILDDFVLEGLPNNLRRMRRIGMETDEINLLYVALTRAHTEVIINDSLFFIMVSAAKENFEEYVQIHKNEEIQDCNNCQKVINCDDRIFTKQKSIFVSSGNQIAEKEICSGCAISQRHSVDYALSSRSLAMPVDHQNQMGVTWNLKGGLMQKVICPKLDFAHWRMIRTRKVIFKNWQSDFVPLDDSDIDDEELAMLEIP